MNEYTINFLELVRNRAIFLYEDNDNETMPSKKLQEEVAKAVANDSELWDKISETIDYWLDHRDILENE